MGRAPDFFLTAAAESRPGADLSAVRACWTKGRLRDAYRDDLMLIEVDPPVLGQPYGLGGEDIGKLVIAPRFRGGTLFPVSEWPFFVYVSRLLDETIIESMAIAQPEQVQLIAWAELYRTREEAEAVVRQFR